VRSARSGLDANTIQPLAGGRAPGWNAGLVVAHRHAQATASRSTHDLSQRTTRSAHAEDLRGDIGRTLTMEDGEQFTVFRHAKVKGDGEPAGGFIVRFTPAHMSVRGNIRFSRLPMIPLLGLHGFREKYWCVNPDTGMCLGVYAWQTVADAEAYAASVALRFMTGRSVPGTVSHQVLDQSKERYWAFPEHPWTRAAA
jgi:hypothetical protein